MTRALNLFVPLLTIAIAGYATYQFMGAWTPDELASPSDGGGGGGQVSDDVKGGAEDSLLQTENYRRALATIRGESGAAPNVGYLRLAPGRINTEIYRGQDGRRLITIGRDGKEASVVTVNSPSSVPGMSPALLNPLAPQRIIGAIAERQKRPANAVADDVDYLVISAAGRDEPTWSVFLKSGEPRFFVAAANGRRLRVPGEPDTQAQQRSLERATRIARCVTDANGDTTKIQACLQR